MGIFRKQTVRAPWTTLLLVLLLALSIAASSIGFAAWTSAGKQAETIEQQYTTIAIPKEQEIDRYELGGTTYEDGSIEWGDGQWYYPPSVVEKKSAVLPQVVTTDRRCLLGAQVKGIPSLTSGRLDILQYNEAMDSYAYNLCVLAVKCIKCDIFSEPGYQDESGTFWGHVSYNSEFEIIAEVSQNNVYESRVGKTISFSCYVVNPDGSVPFEVGNTYFLRGFFEDYPIIEVIDEEKSNLENGWVYTHVQAHESEERDWYNHLMMNAIPEEFTIYIRPGSENEGLLHFCVTDYVSEDLMHYNILPEGSLPLWTEYTGDWQDFLNTPDGQVWRDKIVPICEMNHESATVMLTDNLESLYSFNTGDASILEGESLTKEQLQNGDAVCLISAAYAKANALQVGQRITLDFYNSGYSTEKGRIYGVFSTNDATAICRYPLIPESRIGFEQAYTIVGIYTAPEYTFGVHNFHADTIFVPKASVPNAERYEDPTTPMLNSLILKNGTSEEFERAIAAQGFGDYYLYFDQGYTEAAATVQTLIDNAMRLMLVGVAMFLLASMLFLLLFARRVSAVMRSMRLLGVPKRKTWLESLAVLFAQELTAVAVGNALAVVLYERITAQLLAGTPALDVQSILLCGGVQLGILLLAGGIWMYNLSGRNLMQRSAKIRNTTTAAMSGA